MNKAPLSNPYTLPLIIITLSIFAILLSSCVVVERTETPDGRIVEQTRVGTLDEGIDSMKEAASDIKGSIKDEATEIEKKLETENSIEECNTKTNCKPGYCVLGECRQTKPEYPVIGEVKIFNSEGREKIIDEYGKFNLNAREFYYFVIEADNDGYSFLIKVSSSAKFGSSSKENNDLNFRGGVRQAIYSSNSPYILRVEGKEKNNEYPFFFRPLGFAGDEYKIDIYLEDFKEKSYKSKTVRIPMRIIQS